MDGRGSAVKGLRCGRWLIGLAPLLFLGLFFFYPLGRILGRGFFPDGRLSLAGMERLLSTPYYAEVLAFTTWQAFVSTALTLALALPTAHVFARYRFPLKSLLLTLATLPFVLPTVVVAAAFLALLGRAGLLNRALMQVLALQTPPIRLERTLTLVYLAHIFYNYALAVRLISAWWGGLSPRLAGAAALLGASPWQVFVRVTLPALMPALLTAGALIFLFTFTSFGVILILGGLSYATLEVEIYQQTVGLFNLSVASALSALQLLSTLALSLAYSVLQARYNRPRPLQASQTLQQAPRTWAAKLWVGVNLGVLALVTLAPLLALVERSLWLGEGWGLAYYTALDENRRGSLIFVTPLEAIQNSLRIACVVTLLALVLGTLAAYGVAGRGRVARVLDALYLLPLATSAVTLGFGYVLAFSSPPTAWRASFWLIPAAHTLVALPFVLRSILPSLRAIRPSLRGAAASLGAGVWARFRLIELPLLGRGLLVGGIFAFTVSMGEFGASAFIARPQAPTLPIAIFRLLGQPGSANYGQALALSVLLLLTCALAFWAMERLGRAITGGF